MMRRLPTLLGSVAVAIGFATPALACGGFFCQNTPIDQAGEKVIFGVDGDNVTAMIQIQFSGKARDFSWVVPVRTVPTVSAGSDEVFQRLGAPTRPQFSLKYRTEGTCKTGGEFQEDAMLGGVANNALAPAAAKSGVAVVDEGTAGPFIYKTLASDDATALKTWLTDNGYNIPDKFEELSRSYIQAKNFFVAVKLQQDKDTGDLRPIVLKMKENNPCVPIRLTAIAATPNMPIILWVFGRARAIPQNYYHVKLNEALIDWVGASGGGGFGGGGISIGRPFFGGSAQPAPNYDAVVTASMKEAKGNGFVTEFASSSASVKSVFQHSYDADKLSGLFSPFAFMREVQTQAYPRNSLMQSLFRKYLPLKADLKTQGWTEAQYWNSFFNVQADTTINFKTQYPSFDAASFSVDIGEEFVKPLNTAAAMIEAHPYLTRLYTTMSPEDMTKDPIFSFNSTIGDVSNLHEADGAYLCDIDTYQWNAPIRITLKDGTTFTIGQDHKPLPLGSMPAAFRVEQLSEDAAPETFKDNAPKIADILKNLPLPKIGGAAAVVPGPKAAAPGCACANPANGKLVDTRDADREAAFWGLTLGSLVIWRRRKRKV